MHGMPDAMACGASTRLDGSLTLLPACPISRVGAYLYKGERQIGVVYDPIADEMFSAERGAAHI